MNGELGYLNSLDEGIPSGAGKKELLIAIPQNLFIEIGDVLDNILDSEDCLCSENMSCFYHRVLNIKERMK